MCYQNGYKNLNQILLMHIIILGLSLQDKGQLDEAISYYQKAIKINPNFAMHIIIWEVF